MKFVGILIMLVGISMPALAGDEKQKNVDKSFELGRQYQKEQDEKKLYQKIFDNEKQKEIKKEKEQLKQNEKQKGQGK